MRDLPGGSDRRPTPRPMTGSRPQKRLTTSGGVGRVGFARRGHLRLQNGGHRANQQVPCALWWTRQAPRSSDDRRDRSRSSFRAQMTPCADGRTQEAKHSTRPMLRRIPSTGSGRFAGPTPIFVHSRFTTSRTGSKARTLMPWKRRSSRSGVVQPTESAIRIVHVTDLPRNGAPSPLLLT